MNKERMSIWLDDEPEKRHCPKGFQHFGDVDSVKEKLEEGIVDHLSLDHDLGVCIDCAIKMAKNLLSNSANCVHIETGYDLCKWMTETGHWPRFKPIIHSMNPAGRANMQATINRFFPEKDEEE